MGTGIGSWALGVERPSLLLSAPLSSRPSLFSSRIVSAVQHLVSLGLGLVVWVLYTTAQLQGPPPGWTASHGPA